MKRFAIQITKRNDDQQIVEGYASTPARDYDGDIITLDAMRGALEEYQKFSNIREMHGMSAVGVAKETYVDDHGLWLSAKIVDPLAWLKVKEGVYKAFSIGGNATKRASGDPHTITGLQLIEISLVDRPANPEAVIEVFKSPSAITEEKPMGGTDDEDRELLLTAVKSLSGEALKSAADNLRKASAAVVAPAVEAPPLTAASVKAAAAPVQPTEPPVVTMAKTIMAPGAKELRKAVQAAVGLGDKQFESILKLEWRGLANWLGNNHKVREAIDKAIPADSPLWVQKDDGGMDDAEKPKKPVVDDVAKPHEDKPDGVEKDDGSVDDADKPKGDYGSHEDAGYADPGHQADKKPRYPLKEGGKYSEERIRAAWNYINKPKNQSAYSSEDVASIKSKIVSAWKAHIDKDGPPSAEDDKKKAQQQKPKTENDVTNSNTPDAKGNLRKGLMTACAAIALLNRLDGLQKSIAAEEAREQDGSTAPSRFSDLLKTMSDVVKAYVDEEVAEMLDGTADDYDVGCPYPDYLCYADKVQDLLKRIGGGPAIAEGLTKAMGDRTGSKGFGNLSKLAEEVIAKSKPSGTSADWDMASLPSNGDSNDDWKRKAQDIHDMAKAAGAVCGGDTQKADKGEWKCAKCSTMNGAGVEKCTKCEAAKPAMDKAKKPAPPADSNTDGPNNPDGGDDDEGANPPKPGEKKAAKVEKGLTADELTAAFKAAVTEAVTPLQKGLTELQDQLNSRVKNPPKPDSDKPKAMSVEKGQDVTDKPGEVKPAGAVQPANVLKGILTRPNYVGR